MALRLTKSKARWFAILALALFALTLTGAFPAVPPLASPPKAVHASSGPTIVQSATGSGTTATVSVSFSSSVTAGDILVAAIGQCCSALPTNPVSDSVGNVWTILKDTASQALVEYTIATTSATDTVKLTMNAAPTDGAFVAIYELSGASPVSPASGGGSGSGTAIASGSTSFTADSLLIAVANWGGTSTTYTPGSGFTQTGSTTDESAVEESSTVTSPTTFPATLGASASWNVAGAAFAPATASPFDCASGSPFGTGTADTVISSSTSLSASTSYQNLAIEPGVILNTEGYTLYVCGSLEQGSGAQIFTQGSAGNTGSTGSQGATGSTGSSTATAGGSCTGGTAVQPGAGSSGDGGGGSCSAAATGTVGGDGGGQGGTGGTGSSGGTGGTGGLAPALTVYAYIVDNAGTIDSNGGPGGTGGSGGKGGTGGAGGAGQAGSLSSCGTSGCAAGGGGGGEGGQGGVGGNGGTGGKGGGGNVVDIYYYELSGSGLGTADANGGSGGAGGPGGAAGSGGAGGAGGAGASGSGSCTAKSGGNAGSGGGAGGGTTSSCGGDSGTSGSTGPSGSGGSSGGIGASGAAGTVSETQLSVTQSITVTLAAGSPDPTIGISGCGVTNSTFTADGFAHTYSGLVGSCVITLSNPTAGSNTQYVFSGDGTSSTATESVTTCASGTCTAASFTDYLELQETFKANYPLGTPSVGAPAWAEQAGTQTSIGDLTTSGLTFWDDYGASAHVQAYDSNGGATTTTSDYSAFGGILNASALEYAALLPGTPTSGTPATIPDFSHNNLTGTASGSPTFTTGPISGTGALALQSKSSQYVDVPQSASIDIATLTVAVSFKDPSSTTCQDLVWNNNIASSSVYPYYLNVGCDGSGTYGLEAAWESGTPFIRIQAHSAWGAGWNLLVFTKIANGQAALYVNKTVVGTATDTLGSGVIVSGGSLMIGGDPSLARYSNATIGFVGIWNYAMSQSQELELYSSLFSTTNPQPLEVTPTTAGNSYTFDYYHQYAEAPYYSAVSGTPSGNALNYYYSDTGTSLTDTMGTSAATIWADASTVTVGDHYVSSTERYSSNANVTLSSASTTGPKISVYHQFNQPTKIAYPDGGTTSIALTCPNWGSNVALTLTTSTQHEWADSGGTCSVPATTSIVSGASRLSMGPTDSWSITGASIVPATLNGYLQYYITNPDSISLTLFSNSTQVGSITTGYYADATTQLTAAGLSTNPYTIDYASWLYQVSPSGIQVWSNLTLSPVPSLSASTLSFTSSGKEHFILYVPSSAGLTVSSILDNGVSVSYTGPSTSGQGQIWSASGDSPWQINFGSTSPTIIGGSGGGCTENCFTPPTISTTTLPPCTSSNTTNCEVTNPGQIGLGVIPSEPFLFVIVGGSSLFVLIFAVVYARKAKEKAEEELTFAAKRVQRNLNFSGTQKNRSGPLFRRRKKSD